MIKFKRYSHRPPYKRLAGIIIFPFILVKATFPCVPKYTQPSVSKVSSFLKIASFPFCTSSIEVLKAAFGIYP